jgi:tetratricopeptide (TPR) repeat protein
MRVCAASTLALAVLLVAVCANDAATRDNLNSGYRSLEASQFDDAIARADAHLQKHQKGNGTADALYLRGRAIEQRPAVSQDEARANLQAARDNYREALAQRPAPKLEAYIRTSLANCAYFLDDYTSAASEWTTAYDKLDDSNVRSWVLYRVGICRQRLGQFDSADQVFAMVQREYPNTVPAQRAREHQGARGFTVQFATFANSATADSAVNTLRREGVLPMKATDAQGRSVVRAGPMPTYQQALALKQRYADRYPDALILP